MMEVTTQLGGDEPDQQLVVVFNDDDILFYHHAMPGALHALPTPAGVQDLIKLGAKIVDVGRRNDKWDNLDNSLNQFVHYIMFSYVENGKTLLNFVDLVVETKTQEIGQVNDVTVCLSDFEAKLEADQVAAEKIGYFYIISRHIRGRRSHNLDYGCLTRLWMQVFPTNLIEKICRFKTIFQNKIKRKLPFSP